MRCKPTIPNGKGNANSAAVNLLLSFCFLRKNLKSGLGASSTAFKILVSMICFSNTVPLLSISHTSFFSEKIFSERKKRNMERSFFIFLKQCLREPQAPLCFKSHFGVKVAEALEATITKLKKGLPFPTIPFKLNLTIKCYFLAAK